MNLKKTFQRAFGKKFISNYERNAFGKKPRMVLISNGTDFMMFGNPAYFRKIKKVRALK